MKEAIILAGGYGKRLSAVVNDVPKPMAPVQNKPFVEYLLDYLITFNIDHVVLSVGYMADVITKYFGNKHKSLNITYAIENEPLGTGGGIKLATSFLFGDKALIINGDTYFNINIQTFEEFYDNKKAELLIALKKLDNTSRYGLVNVDADNKIQGFTEKNPSLTTGYINGGIYLFDKQLLTDLPTKFSFEKDFMEKHHNTIKCYGLPFDNNFIDIGIPEDYKRVQTWKFQN